MRKWLYHKNAEPTIFKGEEAIQKALNDGWEARPIAAKEDTIDAEVVTKKRGRRPKEASEDEPKEENEPEEDEPSCKSLLE